MHEQTIYQRIFQRFSLALVLFASALLIYVSYLLLIPVDVIKMNKNPLPVVPPTVRNGQVVSVQMDYCKYRDLDSNLTIDFVGDAVIPSLATQRHFPTGCHVKSLPITIPLSTPSGEYYMHIGITYHVNQLQIRHYDYDTAKVRVINTDNPNR